jgi:hypothetical protein
MQRDNQILIGDYVQVKLELKEINTWVIGFFISVLPILLFSIKGVLDVKDSNFNASASIAGVFAVATFVMVVSIIIASDYDKLYTTYIKIVRCRVAGVFDEIAVEYKGRIYQVSKNNISK